MLVQPSDKTRMFPQCKCAECPLRDHVGLLALPKRDARLALIGEYPASSDFETGELNSGMPGRFFSAMLDKIHIYKANVHQDTVLACAPHMDITPAEWKQAAACCRPRLLSNSQTLVSDRITVAMGRQALYYLTGHTNIKEWIGGPIKGRGEFSDANVVANFHPMFAYARGKRAYLASIGRVLLRAGLLAKGEDKVWTWPTGFTEPNLAMLRALETLTRGDHVAVDVESPGTKRTDKLLVLGLGTVDNPVALPWDPYFNEPGIMCNSLGEKCAALAKEILANPKIGKEFQNGIYDLTTLRNHDIECAPWTNDLMYAHAILSPGLPHGLNFIMAMESNANPWKAEFHIDKNVERRDPLSLRIYNTKDIVATDYCMPRVLKQVNAEPHTARLYEQLMALGRLACKIHWSGMAVDPVARQTHMTELIKRKDIAAAEVKELAASVGLTDFNPQSRLDLVKFYQQALGGKIAAEDMENGTDDDGMIDEPTLAMESFDKKALTKLLGHDNPKVSEFSRSLLHMRMWTSLSTQHIIKLDVDDHGYVHPGFKPHGPITGRWATSCVSADTIIQTSRGAFRIDEYVPTVGDRIQTHTGAWQPILAKYVKGVAPMFRVTLDSGTAIVCTGEHSIYTPQGWKTVNTLATGDMVYHAPLSETCTRSWDHTNGAGCLHEGPSETSDVHNSSRSTPYTCHRGIHHTSRIKRRTTHYREGFAYITIPHGNSTYTPIGQGQSKMDRGARRREGIQEITGGRQGSIRTPYRYCRGLGHTSGGPSINASGTSHRRQQGEQLVGQSSPMYELGTPNNAWPSIRVQEKAPVGSMVVYDLQVAFDHSYIAHGFINHNSPNLLNVPQARSRRLADDPVTGDARYEQLYPSVRNIYTVRHPDNWIVKADFKAQELRLIALRAGAPLMIKWFQDEADVHTKHAIMMFKTKQPSKNERTLIKNLVFNINYLGTEETILSLLRVSHPQVSLKMVRAMFKWYYATHPQIQDFQHEQMRFAQIHDYVEEPFSGRRRKFYGSVEGTEAVNFPIQAGGAHLLNTALLELDGQLDTSKGEHILVPVHDEIVLEGPNPGRLAALLEQAMAKTLTWRGNWMKFSIDCAVGKNWAACKGEESLFADEGGLYYWTKGFVARKGPFTIDKVGEEWYYSRSNGRCGPYASKKDCEASIIKENT